MTTLNKIQFYFSLLKHSIFHPKSGFQLYESAIQTKDDAKHNVKNIQTKPSTTDEILNLNFKTIHNEFFDNLPSLLLNLYNEIIPRFIIQTDECGVKTVRTERYSLNSLQEKFSNEFFLKFYFDLRFSEEENTFSETERQSIIRDCLQIANSTTTRNALNVFERYVNQPFDYRGSLSYLIRARRLSEDT